MPLKLNSFGGTIPKLAPELLPESAAQIAIGVDLSSGQLRVMAITGSVDALHDGSAKLPRIPSTEWFEVAKPNAPSISGIEYHDFNDGKVRLQAKIFVREVTADSNMDHVWLDVTMTKRRWEFTDAGAQATFVCTIQVPFIFEKYRTYRIYGPRFQLRLDNGVDKVFAPETITADQPILPGIAQALYRNNDERYGTLTIHDIDTPIFDDDIFVDKADTKTLLSQQFETKITFNFNFIDPTVRKFYYVYSSVNNWTDKSEGPPSSLSRLASINPGTRLRINCPGTPGFLYRSADGSSDWVRIAELPNGGSYYDRGTEDLGELLPPYGTYPHTDAIAGSVVHPANFGVCFWEDHLFLSDQYRFWVWPLEYAVRFPSAIMAIEIMGDAIVVWTAETEDEQGRVYLVAGSNPAYMNKIELSQNAQLLNVLGICKIDQQIFYVSEDGLMALSGTTAQNITAGHFTRSDWQALGPETMQAYVADGAILLEGDTAKVRIDLDEELARISTYTERTGEPYSWTSRRWLFDEPQRFTAARVTADAAVTLTVYADGAVVFSDSVTDDGCLLLTTLAEARAWELKLDGSAEVQEVSLYESVPRPVSKHGVRIPNDGRVVCWLQYELAFADLDTFCIARVVCQDYTLVTFRLYADGLLVHAAEITSADDFRLPTLPSARRWRFDVVTRARVDEVQLIPRKWQRGKNGVMRLHANQDPWSWLGHRVEFGQAVEFSAIRVAANAYPVTVLLYANGAVVPTATISVTSANGQRLPRLRRERRWELDVIPPSETVAVQEIILAQSMQQLR